MGQYSSKNISEGCFILANIKSKLVHPKCAALDNLEQKIIFEQYRLTPHSKLYNVLYRNLIHHIIPNQSYMPCIEVYSNCIQVNGVYIFILLIL